jgi:hypothetical protein
MLHLLGFRKRVEADRVLMIRRAEHEPHAPAEEASLSSRAGGD